MAYCVRCGVELQKGLETCPLCNTEVVLPDDNGIGRNASRLERIPRDVRPRVNLAPSRAFVIRLPL